MTRSRTPLVDVHAHFITDDYMAAAIRAGHRKPDGMPWPAWDTGQNLKLMDQWGVGTAVLSVSSPGTHFGDNASARALSRQVNEFGAAVTRKYPGRFGHFASLPLPDVTGCLDELRYALDELGSDGVIVLTNARGTYLGDDSFEPLWAELSRRHAVVFVHPASPPCAEALCLGRPAPMMEFIFDTSRTVGDLLFRGVFTRHPGIEWIFTHGGGALPLLADRLELFRTVFSGGSGSGSSDATPVQPQLRRLWFDMAGTPFPHQVPALVDAFGSDRVLYGSDSCWTPAAGVTAQVASIDAASPGGPGDASGGADWRALTSRNAARLLHRFPDARRAVSAHTQLLVTRCDADESGMRERCYGRTTAADALPIVHTERNLTATASTVRAGPSELVGTGGRRHRAQRPAPPPQHVAEESRELASHGRLFRAAPA